MLVFLHSPWGRYFCARVPKESHLSVIFSISTLCFTDSLLPSFCFKDNFYKTSPLVCAFTKLSRLSITLSCHYSLPTLSPTVVGRWLGLFGWLGLGKFAVTDGYFGFCWKWEAAPSNRLAICGDNFVANPNTVRVWSRKPSVKNQTYFPRKTKLPRCGNIRRRRGEII